MERDDRLWERIQEMQAEARERLGSAPPSPEEILAYHEHRLAAAERLRVEAGIAAFPEAARLLRDLARFPDVRPDPGVPAPSEEQIDAAFQAFRRRRREARAPASAPEPERGGGRWFLVAALVVVSAGLGLLAGLLLAPDEGRVNLALASLTPEGEGATRGAETVLRIPRSAEGVLLSLGHAGDPRRPEYTLTVRDDAGEAVWGRHGLAPGPGGSFLAVLPRGTLRPGRYRLELSVPGEPVPAAVYALRVEVD